MIAPPGYVTLAKVPSYLKSKHGIVVSRASIYNWVQHGRKGVKLQSKTILGQHYTTWEWIDVFVANC